MDKIGFLQSSKGNWQVQQRFIVNFLIIAVMLWMNHSNAGSKVHQHDSEQADDVIKRVSIQSHSFRSCI
eukprot:15110115-Ditylum_brightwellii.AAC.1